MKMLTQERLKEVLHYDPVTGLFTRLLKTSNRVKVGDIAGSPDSNGYIHVWVDGVAHKAHRLAWLYTYGEWPLGEIDHQDRNPSNNALYNLRDTTHKQNTENTSLNPRNISGFRGVSWHKASGKFQATITHNYQRIHLGVYATPEDASRAYEAKRNELFTHHNALDDAKSQALHLMKLIGRKPDISDQSVQ